MWRKSLRHTHLIDKWEDLPHGISYQRAINDALQPWLSKLFGVHLLKIGNLSIEIDTTSCSALHQINLAPQGEDLHVQADPLQLPFTGKSVDACLLAHTLSCCDDPHQLLREADRVLIDDGWLLISSFNPISLLGIGKLVPFLRKKPPYNSHMYTSMRLLDWLSLLNFEILSHQKVLVLPWGRKEGKEMLSTHLPVFGTVQILVARKRTIPLTINPLKNSNVRESICSAFGTTKEVPPSIKPSVQKDNHYPLE